MSTRFGAGVLNVDNFVLRATKERKDQQGQGVTRAIKRRGPTAWRTQAWIGQCVSERLRPGTAGRSDQVCLLTAAFTARAGSAAVRLPLFRCHSRLMTNGGSSRASLRGTSCFCSTPPPARIFSDPTSCMKASDRLLEIEASWRVLTSLNCVHSHAVIRHVRLHEKSSMPVQPNHLLSYSSTSPCPLQTLHSRPTWPHTPRPPTNPRPHQD